LPAAAVEGDVPERSVATVPAIGRAPATSWPLTLPRPVCLLDPPQPVEAIALLPDQPPVAFTWRRKRHPIRNADGPDRVDMPATPNRSLVARADRPGWAHTGRSHAVRIERHAQDMPWGVRRIAQCAIVRVRVSAKAI
jgi:hypothetical protein